MQELVRSPSDITRIYFLDLGKENICERLSSVKEILHNNKHFTTEDALNLGIIALYAPRDHACEITEEVVNIYLEIVDDLDLDLESCLYSAITIMIDAFFDDENDYRRLKDMMDIEPPHPKRVGIPEFFSLNRLIKYFSGKPR